MAANCWRVWVQRTRTLSIGSPVALIYKLNKFPSLESTVHVLLQGGGVGNELVVIFCYSCISFRLESSSLYPTAQHTISLSLSDTDDEYFPRHSKLVMEQKPPTHTISSVCTLEYHTVHRMKWSKQVDSSVWSHISVLHTFFRMYHNVAQYVVLCIGGQWSSRHGKRPLASVNLTWMVYIIDFQTSMCKVAW